MDRGAWRATVHGSQRAGQDLTTKQQQTRNLRSERGLRKHCSPLAHQSLSRNPHAWGPLAAVPKKASFP